MENRAERRQTISSALNKKSLEERLKTHTQVTAVMAAFAFAGFVCSLICVCLLGINKAAQDELNAPAAKVECSTENNVGYTVVADWTTTGYDYTVMYTVRDGEALSVAAQPISEINYNAEVLCTKDNLGEYLKYAYAKSMYEAGLELDSYSASKYPIIGVDGYLVKTTQYVTQDNVRMPTYASALYFIYEEYLYSFSYTVAARNYMPADFDEVLRSIRIIPESEQPQLLPDREEAQDIISEYSKFFDNVGVDGSTKGTAEVADTKKESAD